MSGNVSVCSISDPVRDALKSFRFRKGGTAGQSDSKAIVLKIDRPTKAIVIDEVLEDLTADELRDSLPDHQPRFALYTFRLDHEGDGGRVSYPMCLIYSTPRDCQTELQMMYAGTKLSLVKEADLTKVFEIRELDELTDEWLRQKLLK